MRSSLALILTALFSFILCMLMFLYLHERINRQLHESEVQEQSAVITQLLRQAADSDKYEEFFLRENSKIKSDSSARLESLRYALKTDTVSMHCVPDNAAVQLLEYAHEIHSRHPDSITQQSDDAGPRSSSPSCRLTYGQTIYWTERLLAALDESSLKLALSMIEKIKDDDFQWFNLDWEGRKFTCPKKFIKRMTSWSYIKLMRGFL